MFLVRAFPFLLLCGFAWLALAAEAQQVAVRVIAINDFHGHLEPPEGAQGMVSGQPAGGAAFLAAHVQSLRKEQAHHILVSAGDLINASPYASALYQDEPTVEVMNRMGLALNAVGNHEFDDGIDELRRMQNGGCHPRLGCRFQPTFEGAKFRFLAANVVNRTGARPLFPPYEIRTFDGVPVAFIGMTLEGTRSLVNAAGIAGWEFRNESRTANALVPELRARGVEAIVLLIHEGGYADGGPDECPSLSGPIVNVLRRLDPAIDVVISGHTHQAYNCSIDGRLVTSAGSYGRVVTSIDLTLDRTTRDVAHAQARNVIVTRDVRADEQIDAIVARAVAAAGAHDRVSGRLAYDLVRTGAFPRDVDAGGSGESVLGNLIADAQLWATREAGAEIAFMNPGGLRADIRAAAGGEVRFSQLFAAQPFSNRLVTLTLTGAQILALLEQQFPVGEAGRSFPRVLQVSTGFGYAWSATAAKGKRVRDVSLKGKPIEQSKRYRVTANDFLVNGGDRFGVLKSGTQRRAGPLDVEALEAYFTAFSPVKPPALGRIRRLD
jgi:5'-nucleotidase